MSPNKLWNDGAFFGAASGSLLALYAAYLLWLPSQRGQGAGLAAWVVVILAPLAAVLFVLWMAWVVARQPLCVYLRRRAQDAARGGAPVPLQLFEPLPDTGPEGPDPATAAVPTAELVLDPFAEYMRCRRQLWRLEVKGQDDGARVDALRAVMRSCWAQMSEDQRYRADVEGADVWKYVCDEDD